jgi:hypothetical protein
MLLDSLLEFSDAQAVTSTAISTNVIDLGPVSPNTTRDIGAGEPVYLVIQTETTCTDTSSDATVAFTLESDSTADLATSATVHFSTGAKAFATYATAGTQVVVTRLPGGEYEQYLGVRYTVASGPLTAGKFNAFLTKDVQNWRSYENNQTIYSGA